jgi:hypothetical protein
MLYTEWPHIGASIGSMCIKKKYINHQYFILYPNILSKRTHMVLILNKVYARHYQFCFLSKTNEDSIGENHINLFEKNCLRLGLKIV